MVIIWVVKIFFCTVLRILYKSSDEPHLLLAKFVRSWDSSSHDDVKFWYERCKDLGPSIPSGCCSWGGNNFIYIFYDQYQLSSVGIAG